MTNPASALQPAIDALEKDLAELERQGNALLTSINVLRAKAGLPPRPGGWSSSSTESAIRPDVGYSPLPIHSDTFLGKRMGSAAREYLDMRKTAGGDAPATVREIFDALKGGGFDFKSKDDGNAIIVLRAMLRKNSSMFHKLQNGKYGLRAWYPNLKPPKANASDSENAHDDSGDGAETEAADTKKASAA